MEEFHLLNNAIHTGRIVEWFKEKGWGRIRTLKGETYFVHKRQCYFRPRVDNQVEFQVEISIVDRRRTRACEVRLKRKCIQGTVIAFNLEDQSGVIQRSDFGGDVAFFKEDNLLVLLCKGSEVVFDVGADYRGSFAKNIRIIKHSEPTKSVLEDMRKLPPEFGKLPYDFMSVLQELPNSCFQDLEKPNFNSYVPSEARQQKRKWEYFESQRKKRRLARPAPSWDTIIIPVSKEDMELNSEQDRRYRWVLFHQDCLFSNLQSLCEESWMDALVETFQIERSEVEFVKEIPFTCYFDENIVEFIAKHFNTMISDEDAKALIDQKNLLLLQKTPILHKGIRQLIIQVKQHQKKPVAFIFKMERHLMNRFLKVSGLEGYHSVIVCAQSIACETRPYTGLHSQLIARSHSHNHGLIVLCRNPLDAMNCHANHLKSILLYEGDEPCFIGHFFAVRADANWVSKVQSILETPDLHQTIINLPTDQDVHFVCPESGRILLGKIVGVDGWNCDIEHEKTKRVFTCRPHDIFIKLKKIREISLL